MMLMGERAQLNLSVQAPPWSILPVYGITGESNAYHVGDPPLSPLQLFDSFDGESDDPDLSDAPVNAYACDEFRMYEFKVRRCARGRSHDWTECPYAHPGEKARRRDPRRFRYSGTACPDFRKGTCRRSDACEFAHGVFECWLHPERYRTQPCKDGTACRRRVCFFAHTPDQLRVLTPALQLHSPRSAAVSPDSYDGSPLRRRESPPMSPMGGSRVTEILASLRNLRLSRSMTGSWGFPVCGDVAGSPRDWGAVGSGFCSLPVTPKRSAASGGVGWLEGGLDMGFLEEEEPVERVESGRALRAKMVERLSMENGMEVSGSGPDLGWVCELVT